MPINYVYTGLSSIAIDFVSDLQVKKIEWTTPENKYPACGICKGFRFPDVLDKFNEYSCGRINVLGWHTYSRNEKKDWAVLRADIEFNDIFNGTPTGCEFDVQIEVDEYGKTDIWIEITQIKCIIHKVTLTAQWPLRWDYDIFEICRKLQWSKKSNSDKECDDDMDLPF